MNQRKQRDADLWFWFSRFIRLRDSDNQGYCRCFTCRRVKYWKEGDCGHGVGRQHMATKYDEKNNHFQCKHCNGLEEGMKDRYKEEMNRRYGPQTWDLMVIKSRSVNKWGKFEIDALTEHYKTQALKLAAEKGIKLAA